MNTRIPFARAAPVVRGVGLLLHVPAAMAVVSMPIAWLFGERDGFVALICTAMVAVIAGQALYWPCRGRAEIHRHHAMVIAALAWLAIPAVAALPFVLAGPPVLQLWENALFEAISGFTGTGLTMALHASELPHVLQWWRSLSQWIGGVGVIVLLLAVLPANRSALELFRSEGRDQKILPNVRATVAMIWSIYLLYTLLSIALLWLAGADVWTAINHAMTAIATGGFTIHDGSLAGVATQIKLAYLPIMTLGAISFLVHYRLLRGGDFPRALFSGIEMRWFWCLLIGGAAILVFENARLAPEIGVVDGLLQWVSAMSTTGVQSAAVTNWPMVSILWLCVIMFAGGMAGSTSGGLKTLRLVMVYKNFSWGLAALSRRPHQVLRYLFDGEALTSADAHGRARAATVLAISWALLAGVGVLALAHCVGPEVHLQQIVFETLSAQSGVGLSAGITGPDLPLSGKVVLMLLMWMGRLEIVPAMVLLAVLVNRGR